MRVVAPLSLVALLTACAGEVPPENGADGGSGGEAGQGGDDDGSAESCDEVIGADRTNLLSCAWSPSCEPFYSHNYIGPEEAVACAGALVYSAEPGVLLSEYRPGPGGFESDAVAVLLGDGSAIVQVYSRRCEAAGPAPGCCTTTFGEQLLCDVVLREDAAAACEAGEEGCDFGFINEQHFENCVAVEERSCDEVKALVEGA